MTDQQNAQMGTGDSEELAQDGNNLESMESLMQSDAGLEFPSQGEIRKGVIASISSSQILVSVGAKSEGVIAGRELDQIPATDRAEFQMGMEIPVYVINPEDDNGNVVLSYVRAREAMGWEVVEKMQETGEPFDGIVDGYNKGGLIVLVHGLRGFVPASQISLSRRNLVQGDTPDRWAKQIGETISVRIIEVDRERRRLILSERAANPETRQSIKERVIDELVEGSVHTGRVTSVADFGAFVNINGADGLVHLSEVSWERVQHPSEVLKVGDEVKVKVINIDREKRRIGLSIKALLEDPWQDKVSHFKVGQLLEGTITRLTKFGAFARLEGDIEGLIHISELSENRINHPKEAVKEGDVLTLRVIRIDADQRRIGLSLRKVDSASYSDMDLKALTAELNEDEANSEPKNEPDTKE
ncbi:MAG: 30S ribosomal protein S1 [Anaerolineae bacterium CG_4_9_14_3_um_filter_57_17]|nr:S1 RNA-binding domain-containing protein [bacterium]NCT20603.1 S1 RNA-binding domain-containing protein [bacterium]OIO85650.1 MAG: 30S ribosomal protein S1 [Anaerolineae bacterium CG2_30_57_67]PJB68464.1 MAG: 30S ribosomal protein S1 [Anaerolineae bacterium CG_4_9_14_3_um_filter_57_17]